jgi:CBS domain-containing protein
MLVRELMSRDVVTVEPSCPLEQAIQRLDAYDITAMPVVDEHGRVVGVLSEADVLRDMVLTDPRAHERPVQVSSAVASRRVGEVMSTMPLTVAPESDLAEAVALLVETQVKSLPVVSHDRLVGVLSRRDLVRALARQDDQIEAQVDELLRSATLECEVTGVDGVVQISAADDPRVRAVARSLAGTVPGVVAIAFTE